MKTSFASFCCALALIPFASQAARESSYEILENGAGKFKIDIAGCSVASANVESIQIDDLTIDVRETTTGADWDYRTFAPGDAHFGSITIRSRVGKTPSELFQWMSDTAAGKNIRKNISVIIKDRAGNEARRYNLLECYPTRWDPGEYSPSSNVRCETIVCKMGRVELAAVSPPGEGEGGGDGEDPASDSQNGKASKPPAAQAALDAAAAKGQPLNRPSFRIEVTDPVTGNSFIDDWESCTGGAFALDTNEKGDIVPWSAFISEIQLRGPMTASRKWIGQIISNTVSGKSTRFDLTITEIMQDGTDGKRFHYTNCFLTRYVYPVLSADGTGNLYEEVSLKPERLEMK